VVALKCLWGISRGIQVPADKPVDLEKQESTSPFWDTGNGSRVQQRIYSMMCRVYDILGNRGEIIDVTCHILRQGFRESEPGPFVLPPHLVAQFLMKANSQTPRLGTILTTAGFLVISQKWGTARIAEVLTALLNWVAQLLESLGGKPLAH